MNSAPSQPADPTPRPTLVCFAVKEEAAPFRKQAGFAPGARILLTGMGRRRAERAIRKALADLTPALVLTCGFAGGLRPDLTTGEVLYDATAHADFEVRLRQAGARPARFHLAPNVVPTAREKADLYASVGADAVEMESLLIASICKEQRVPCVIVRVVLDPAGEDFPVDFNAFLNADQELDLRKLLLAVIKSPSKIWALLRLRKQSRAAAEKLAQVLVEVLKRET